MKSKYLTRLSFFIVISLLISVSGCGDQPIATMDDSVAMGITGLLPKNKLIKNTEKTPQDDVAILFLIDKSESIVGKGTVVNKCNTSGHQDSRYMPHEAVQYLFNIFSELPSGTSEHFHVGISQFGDAYKPIIELTPANELGDIIFDIDEDFTYSDASSRFDEALEKAYKDLSSYASKNNIDKQIIIFITDGFGVNRDLTESVLAKIPIYLQMRTYLVCPQDGDTSFWPKHRIPTSNFPDKWLADFWSLPEIKSAMPLQSGWVDGKKEKKVLVIGNVNEIQFKYFSWRDPNKSKFEVNGNTVLQNNSPIVVTPKQGCTPHEFNLKSGSLDAGLWWVETKSPIINNIIIESEKITNNGIVAITAHLSGLDFKSGELEKWRECYKNEDFFYEAKTLESQQIQDILLIPNACEDGGLGLCPEKGGNGLYKTWYWSPPLFTYPRDIKFVLTLNPDKLISNQPEVSSRALVVPMAFRPLYNSIKPNMQLTTQKFYYFDVIFDFDIENDKGKPNVYLLQTEPELSGVECPNTEILPNIPHPAYFVQQNSSQDGIWANVVTKWKDGIGSYSLGIKKDVLDRCGFEKALFVWEKNTIYKLEHSVWECNLREMVCED